MILGAFGINEGISWKFDQFAFYMDRELLYVYLIH